jgi:hypothetical protein
MDSNGKAVCLQCGAIGCKDKYGEMLALEFEQPTIFGAVHHITVNCYNLQHPAEFSDEALAWMKEALHDIVEHDLPGPALLKRARSTFGGDYRVRRNDTRARAPARTRWSMTVADVRTDSPEIYVENVRTWAASILEDLGTK